MHNGTRPSRHAHLVKKYPHFGAIAPENIADFDLGRNLPLQDQEKDNAPYECVGYTTAHILSSIFNENFSPDFSYAAARYIAGDGAEGAPGTSFHAGMDSIVGLGGLTQGLSAFSASSHSEKYVSDWANFPDSLKKVALEHVQNGVRNVLGNGDAFDSILGALHQGGIPVSIGTPWFTEWRSNINGGVLQTPIIQPDYQSWHNHSISGKTTINGVPYLIDYSWQGNRVGDGGKLYLSREAINTALTVWGSGALTIDPSVKRWVYLVGLILRRFPNINPLLISKLVNV